MKTTPNSRTLPSMDTKAKTITDKLWDIQQLIQNYPAFSHWGVRWMVKTRRIPMVRLGRRIYFRPEEIERWIAANSISAEAGDDR